MCGHRFERQRDIASEARVRARGGEGDAYAMGGFQDARADLHQPRTDGGEFGFGQRMVCGMASRTLDISL